MANMGDIIEDIQRTFMRRIRRVEYKNVPLPPGYAETEQQYKMLRDSIAHIDTLVRTFVNYEHGGVLYKNIKEGMQYINSKASLGFVQNMDMYERLAKIGEELSKDKDLSRVGSGEISPEKFQHAFTAMSESKKRFNEKTGGILSRIKEIRAEIKRVDSKRRKAKNSRYDAEIAAQKKNAAGNDVRSASSAKISEDVERFSAEYKEKAKVALDEMKNFVKEVSAADLMKDLVKNYRNHLEECVASLKKID